MNKTRISLAIMLMFAAWGARGDAFSTDDLNWLKKIAVAAHQTDYSGTFIYQSGNHVETSRITHLSDGKDEYEKLEGQDGERSEIFRKNNQVWCYKGEGRVMVAKRDGARMFPALLPEQFSLLRDNYLIRHGDEDRVAGLPAHSILFQPKDKMRYAHKIWVHNESGLLLKAVVLDEHDHVIEQYAFTQMKIGGDIDRKWIMRNKPAAEVVSASNLPAPGKYSMPAQSKWIVYDLPAGFTKIAEVSRNLRGNKHPVAHLVYSDGLAGISVFIEALEDRHSIKPGLQSKGVIHVFSRVMDANLLTVVGEVPAHTIMQVAESVRNGAMEK